MSSSESRSTPAQTTGQRQNTSLKTAGRVPRARHSTGRTQDPNTERATAVPRPSAGTAARTAPTTRPEGASPRETARDATTGASGPGSPTGPAGTVPEDRRDHRPDEGPQKASPYPGHAQSVRLRTP